MSQTLLDRQRKDVDGDFLDVVVTRWRCMEHFVDISLDDGGSDPIGGTHMVRTDTRAQWAQIWPTQIRRIQPYRRSIGPYRRVL